MASKRKWKKRAKKREEALNGLSSQYATLFDSNAERATQLARIDTMLMQAEFPGPTIEAYVAQVQRFLQDLVDERKLVKKSSGADPSGMRTEGFISGHPSKSSPSTEPSPPEGEMLILDDQPSAPWDRLGSDRFL